MPRSVPLTGPEGVRYSRHLVLPEVGTEGQRRLKGSAVLIVGVGGLGVPAAVYLASAGVGKIGIVDKDVVEMPNLQRQFIFNEADLGHKKVEVAADRLRRTNPNIEVVSHDLKLDSENALDLIRGYDVVIDATDNLPSRYLISDACVMLGKPDVYASVLGFDGQATVFWAKMGPCYRCLHPKPPPADSVQSCEDAGVLGVLPGVMGGLQAVQTIQILLEKGSPLVGRLLVFNGLDTSFDEVKIKKASDCAACGPIPTISKLIDYDEFCGVKEGTAGVEFNVAPMELKAEVESGRHVALLDVREQWEYDICHLDGAKLLPLGELRERMGELNKGEDTVVYCHVGVRSTEAVAMLRKAGFINARNLRGGIDAWAMQVNQNVPRY